MTAQWPPDPLHPRELSPQPLPALSWCTGKLTVSARFSFLPKAKSGKGWGMLGLREGREKALMLPTKCRRAASGVLDPPGGLPGGSSQLPGESRYCHRQIAPEMWLTDWGGPQVSRRCGASLEVSHSASRPVSCHRLV